jgi:hypothetical protein
VGVVVGLQNAFVALATNATLRRLFGQDRDAALAGFDLEVNERVALRALPLEPLERYARSLVEKRWGELARVVPLTLRVAPSLRDKYRAWALEHPAYVRDSVLSPGAAEAQRALIAMRAALTDEAEAVYAADLYAFEVLGAASRCDGIARGMRSAFAIQDIAADIARGLVPIDPERSPTEIAFGRRP